MQNGCSRGAGRSLSLLDPTYASKYIPIIASVSEHQPPAWPSYFTDLNLLVRRVSFWCLVCDRLPCRPADMPPAANSHPLGYWRNLDGARLMQVLLAPAGIIACFKPLTDASLFLVLYGLAAVYFSGVMVSALAPVQYSEQGGCVVAAAAAACFCVLHWRKIAVVGADSH